MANLSPNEQLVLELINRARMDPNAEADRLGLSDLNEGVPVGSTISGSGKQVLAANDQLGSAAARHSQWMLDTDTFSHYEGSPTDTYYDPTKRIEKAGYTGWSTNGENIAYVASTAELDTTDSAVANHDNLFIDANYSGRGHRTNLMKADFKEIGLGLEEGVMRLQTSGGPRDFNVSMLTEDFATKQGSNSFITGVVYSDTTTKDDFFTVGEQTANRKVSGSGASDKTGAGGGYELEYATTGNKTITFDLAGADLKVKVKLGDTNVKIDAVNGREIWTNASSLASESTSIKELHALGIGKVNLTGSSANEKIYGNGAANSLTGKGGDDKISGGKGADTIVGGYGEDTLTGGKGDDKFVFNAGKDSRGSHHDLIKDFDAAGNDRIDLRSLGNLTYKDEAAIDGADQVNVTRSGDDVLVHVNLDADLDDELLIRLDNCTLSSMGSDDFIL